MIYVIRDTQDGRVVGITTDPTSGPYYASIGYALEAQPDATIAEQLAVDDLNAWLREHYDDGAHWVYETTSPDEHVAALRSQTMDAYKQALRARWELLDSVATDIRGA